MGRPKAPEPLRYGTIQLAKGGEASMALDRGSLEKPFKKVRKRLKRWSKVPTPSQVHTLRTNSRRIESIMEALERDSRKDRKLLRPLGKVRKLAGKVRDMDVLTSLVIGLKTKGEEECVLRLVQDLSASRHKHAQKMFKPLKKYRSLLRRHLKKTISQLDRAADGASGQSDDVRKASTEIAGLILGLSKDLNDPPRLNRENLHPFRLKLKNLRYILEMAPSQDRDPQFVEALKSAQNAIGEWHDWEALKQIAKDLLDHQGCELLQQIHSEAAGAYERGIAAANAVRSRYAFRMTPQRLRAGGSHRRPPRSLSATVTRIA
jgi:CHAD domain-containing protein